MKSFVAFFALVAVAVASPVKRPIPLPAIIDFPVASPCDSSVVPSPVVIGDLSPDQPAPLVQIIVNVNQVGLAPAPVDEVVGPVPETPVIDPVQVVDLTPVVEASPVQVVDVIPVVEASPVQVVDLVPVVGVDAVNVVDISPGVAPAPVHVITPIQH